MTVVPYPATFAPIYPNGLCWEQTLRSKVFLFPLRRWPGHAMRRCMINISALFLLPAGDPHMTGFLGQKFDFTGDDGQWYNLVSDGSSTHINMRVTSPVPSLPVITYITGLSIMASDSAGIDHSIAITVKVSTTHE